LYLILKISPAILIPGKSSRKTSQNEETTRTFFNNAKSRSVDKLDWVLWKHFNLWSNLLAAAKALVHACVVCKAQMPDPKTYKQHFENKHPKAELPADLKDVVV
jgi:hypothetical protein